MERKQTHIAYGFITAVAMILVNVILVVTKMNMKPGVQWLGFVPFLIGIIMNANAYSKANNGSVTFGQVFGSCFKATAIIAIVSVAWGFASMYIFPNMMDEAMEQARAKMAQNKDLSEEQIEQAMGYTRKFFKPLMVAGALFGTLFFGAIFSLIGAAVAKKNPQQVYPG